MAGHPIYQAGVQLPATEDDVRESALQKEVDIILSKELQGLSIQTRTMVQEEIHGVTNLCPEETPEMMEEALQSVPSHKRVEIEVPEM